MASDSKLRWGILGTGNIARQFATGLATSERGRVVAVASRTQATADAFAQKFGVPAALGSYAALLTRDDVDAVYVSLPNTMHHAWTIASLRAGKHVLCEKPLAVTATEAREMFDAARAAERVLLEAFMYRAHPQTLKAVELVRAGAIGRPNLIRTSFCYRVRTTAGNIRFDASLAGGALMDVGCYCVDFSRLFAGLSDGNGEPVALHAVGRRHAGGVDEQVSAVLKFADGATAEFTAGMMTQADNTAFVCGDEGYLRIPVPWKPRPGAGEVTVAYSIPPKQDGPVARPVPPPATYAIADARDVYAVEADAFAAAVLDGAPPFVAESDSMGNAIALDALRAQLDAS
jgi:predicted dehydrogenase